jgi:hypothetical protein
MTEEAGQVAATYFSAWKAGDFATFRSVLADNIIFDGPLGHVEGGDACAEALQRMSRIVTDIVVQKRFIDGPDVLTWFDLHTSVSAAMPHGELESCREREDHAGPGGNRPAATGPLSALWAP